MGLDIVNYSYGYSTLHKLRQLALDYEGIKMDIRNFYDYPDIETRFNEFINHCDCDGIYVSKSNPNYKQLKKQTLDSFGSLNCYFGDLDKLKQEVQELNNYMLAHAGVWKGAWIAFYTDVMEAEDILEFR